MPKLFKKFDKDGNGDLEMEEFCAAWQAGEDLSKIGIDQHDRATLPYTTYKHRDSKPTLHLQEVNLVNFDPFLSISGCFESTL